MQTCAEYVRLWRLYAKATADHIELENRLREIVVKQPWESAVRNLTISVEAAARVREHARDAIRTHEAVAHGNKTGSASG